MTSESSGERAPSAADRLVRVIWWVVSILGAVMLLALVAVASTAVLSPDAFVDPCHRPQLLTPASCAVDD